MIQAVILLKKHWKLLAVIGLVFGSFASGWKVHSYKTDAEKLALIQSKEALERSINLHRAEIDDVTEKLRIEQRKKNRVITKEIIKYVPTVTLPIEFDSLHDCQVRIGTTDSACKPYAATGALTTDKEALSVILGNYQHCQDQMEVLRGLQRWIKTQ